MVTETAVWQALAQVMDPEIPVVSLVEMGIIREVAVETDGRVTVTMTPTFSGCPALEEMKTAVVTQLHTLGAADVHLHVTLAPPWSSDWISDTGRAKLKAFGLAPPARHGGQIALTFFDPVACPFCDSTNTSVKNNFGATLCRAIHYCHACQQPFEQFKAL
jgi:ring-1,2-phenylacetyl-CoA epoxidase subunit PaaD